MNLIPTCFIGNRRAGYVSSAAKQPIRLAVLVLMGLALGRGSITMVRAQQPQSRSATIHGRVVDARSGEPVAKVKIIVSGTSQSTITDESGSFTLTNLPQGELDLYITTVGYGVAPSEFLPPSRAAVMKALEADETVAYAHSMLGRISYQYDWDFSRANREYTRARELEPKLVHSWYGFYLLALNRVAEAEAEHKKFEEFLPFAPGSGLAQHLYFSRQYDPAVHLLNKKLESNPDVPLLHEWLGLVYEQQGRSREAIDEFQKAINLSHGVDGVGALGHVYAVSGRFSDAETTLRKLNDLSKRIYVSPYQKAVIYAGLGKKDEALRLLEKAYGERSLSPTSLRYDPRLNELRADPRFQDFIKRTGMPL